MAEREAYDLEFMRQAEESEVARKPTAAEDGEAFRQGFLWRAALMGGQASRDSGSQRVAQLGAPDSWS